MNTLQSTASVTRLASMLLGSAALLAGCGGGGSEVTAEAAAAPATADATAAASGTSDQRHIAAATATAQSSTNACAADAPFYWEIGNRNGRLASGSVADPSSRTSYDASSVMAIASASKWLYAAYVVQKQNAALSDSDVSFLHFTSGYTSFSTCTPNQTVDGCENFLANGNHSDATDGHFFYGGGHMQKHATLIGLGPLANTALAAELRSQLGTDIGLTYAQPQLAGGVVSSADDYARFLRKVLGGQLLIGTLLGSHAVCTNPATCPSAISTPVPASESWHYSIGHWVEDDPAVGDGAFSSAGAFGFYPWIDASKTWYGIVARHTVDDGEGYDSAQCGRLIRKAWLTGIAS